MAWKMTRGQQVGAVALAALFLVPPIPTRVASDFMLEPGREARVRAESPGLVRQVLVRQGQAVNAGEALAVLYDPGTEAQANRLSQQLALAEAALRSDESAPGSSQLGAAVQEKNRLERETALAQSKVDALLIRAPFAGIVSTPVPNQKTGQYLAAGDEFCEVVDRSSMKARILVRDWELEDVHVGSRAELKVVPFALRTYSGNVDKISPAAATDLPVGHPERLARLGQQLTNYVALEMIFPNPDGTLTEGMTGTAKIAGKPHPLAWQVGRAAWRWLRSQVW